MLCWSINEKRVGICELRVYCQHLVMSAVGLPLYVNRKLNLLNMLER